MKLIIMGTFPGLNEYINAERTNRYKAAAMKKQVEHVVILAAKKWLKGKKFDCPVVMHYTWIEKNRRRDHDNVSSFGRKCIQDALVKGGWLAGDGWNHIAGFSDSFLVDAVCPRVEIEIEETTGEETMDASNKPKSDAHRPKTCEDGKVYSGKEKRRRTKKNGKCGGS